MSILTKTCVVVLLVLILFACPVFITQATVAPNWRYAYQQKDAECKAYQMDAKAEKLAHNATIEQRDGARDSLNALREGKNIEMAKLSAELSAARSGAAAFQNNLGTLAAKVGGLEREATNFNHRNDLLAAQLDKARKDIDKLTKEVIGVSELLKQTEAEKARVNQLARTFQQTIRELEEENEQLRQSGGVVRADGEQAAVVGDMIIGTVEAVRGNYASINIGSAKGIKRNMKLIIYRGSQFIGWLRIDEVDVDQAAGIIVNPMQDPRQGDKVTNKLLD